MHLHTNALSHLKYCALHSRAWLPNLAKSMFRATSYLGGIGRLCGRRGKKMHRDPSRLQVKYSIRGLAISQEPLLFPRSTTKEGAPFANFLYAQIKNILVLPHLGDRRTGMVDEESDCPIAVPFYRGMKESRGDSFCRVRAPSLFVHHSLKGLPVHRSH